jgi:CRP-like cAMP-binding protein
MTIALSDRIDFLKKSHLFRSLTDEQVEKVAASMDEAAFPAGGVIVEEGKLADGFYLIYNGQAVVTRKRRGGDEQLATRVQGDYFGEIEAARRTPRIATVTAQGDTVLLTLSNEDFSKFLKELPRFKNNIAIAISSRRLARKLHSKWVQADEVIYFLARKHPIILWESLTAPILLLVIPAILFGLSWWFNNTLILGAGGIFLLFDLLWVVWKWIDWGNDFYIVTNTRAIWLEKVIGLYESRQEAPLSNIVYVGTETDAVGRMLDYGNVNVRTFVGRIVFGQVEHPAEAAALINELRERVRYASRKLELETMKQAMRQRMGLSSSEAVRPAAPMSIAVPKFYKPGFLQALSSRFFTLRSESKDTITYHKHWFVWLRQTFKPWLLIIGVLLAMIFVTFLLRPTAATPISILTVEVDTILGLVLIASILWLIYEWVDWSNDIYQVTPDNILDIDKTPIGREERKVAPLENILSTSYERLGLLGQIFNYGTVYVTVGGAQMEFEDVFDPAGVQQDIDNRRSARIFKKKAEADAAERDRMADWFATYHRNVEEFRREEEEEKKREANRKPSQSNVQ